MYVSRYSFGHELLCAVEICEFHPEEMVAFYCCITAVSLGSATRGETIVWILLPLLRQPGENTVTAAVSVRREVVWGYVVLCYVCCYSWLRQTEENKRVFSSSGSLSLLPASCLPPVHKQCGQCEQWGSRCCEQDEEQYRGYITYDWFTLLYDRN